VYRDADVLLTPAAPATTPPVDTPEGALEGLFTAIFNVTGVPALARHGEVLGELPQVAGVVGVKGEAVG
jgi:Asp-tRNA(Asn)/Glu-tRNA(Gln) amidotransferase A subunit family amidase